MYDAIIFEYFSSFSTLHFCYRALLFEPVDNLSATHEITFYDVIFEYFPSRQTDKFKKNSCKIEKNVYNINECIFRAGCNSLPVVKVHDPTQYSRLIW